LSNRNSEARALVSEAYSLAVRLNEPELILNSSELLSDIYESGADFRKAYHFHRIFKRMADSLFGMELKKGALELQFKYEWDKKSALLQAEKESALALEREKAARQKVITASIIGFLCVVLFFGAIFINRYKIINRQKTVIELQKTVLEKRNKDVTDSIMYAKRIQEALLKEQEYVTSHLPDHFVYFRPKDIVSGDFYWSHEKQLAADDGESRIWYLAAADCTGHGVPGAMMSMLGVSFLNEICTDEKAHSPAEILDNLRDRIVNELSSPTHDVKDGMDISLVKLDLRSGEAEWAGANNPLWIIRMDQGIPSFEELKGDKQPIGAHHQAKPFLAHKLRLNPGDTCYLFTDGYADQFGGDKGGAGKKFLYRRLKEMFLEMSHLPMQEQKKMLDKRFDEWRGRLEQVDDVCVIGFRY
jgi:serine phosphatase RsbU (regulator of sigma subunit)